MNSNLLRPVHFSGQSHVSLLTEWIKKIVFAYFWMHLLLTTYCGGRLWRTVIFFSANQKNSGSNSSTVLQSPPLQPPPQDYCYHSAHHLCHSYYLKPHFTFNYHKTHILTEQQGDIFLICVLYSLWYKLRQC